MESYKISNGGTLEDCYTNLFALTDLTGIRWRKLSAASHFHCVDPLDDPVLLTFSQCLQEDILCVWRRVLKTEAADFHRTIDVTSKELWVFWYGEEPPNLRKILSQELIETEQGSWDVGLSYECRTLLFKAMHNLIEKCLLSRNFVRLGRWFVQPYNNSSLTSDKSSHLSISFHFFLHGESTVCSSVDVREHPPIRHLTYSHITLAQTTTTDVKVILAPHGLSGVLTGQTFKKTDHQVSKLLEEWKQFYPLDEFEMLMRTDDEIPVMVEVVVGGTRMKYPTCYVLVTDIDYLDQRLLQSISASRPPPLTPAIDGHYSTYESGHVEIPMGAIYPDGRGDGEEESGFVFDCLIDKAWQDQIIVTGQKRSAENMVISHDQSEPEEDIPAAEWSFNEPVQKVHCGCPRFRSKNRYNPSSKDRGLIGTKYSRFEKSDKSDYKPSKHSRVPFYRRPIQPDHVGDEVDFIMAPQSVGTLHVFDGLNHMNQCQFETASPHSGQPSPLVQDVNAMAHATTEPTMPTLSPHPEATEPADTKPANPDTYTAEPSNSAGKKPGWMDVSAIEPMELPPVCRPDLMDSTMDDDTDSVSAKNLYDFSSQESWLDQPLKRSRVDDQQPASVSPPPQSPATAQLDPYEFSDDLPGNTVNCNFHSKDFETIESPVNVGTGLVNEKDLVPTYTDLDRIFESDDDSNDCIKDIPNVLVKPEKTDDQEMQDKNQFSMYHSSQQGSSLASATSVPGTIGAQELSTMFPTPPSMEATNTSPSAQHIEPHSTDPDYHDEIETKHEETESLNHVSPIMAIATLGSEKYSSIELPSHRLQPISGVTSYKPSLLLGTVQIVQKTAMPVQQHRFMNANMAMDRCNPQAQIFDRLSVPVSPAAGFHASQQRTPMNCDIASPASNSSSYVNRNLSSIENIDTNSHTPEAYSLIVNITLSDTILALFKDHNFDSCNICVCNMSIKGNDVGLYLPDTGNGEPQYRCTCGFSAIINRKYSFHSGLFYEDEVEITQKRDDRFDFRKPPLIETRPGYDEGENLGEEVLKLLRAQFCGLHVAVQLSLPSYHKKMLWSQEPSRSPGALTNRLEFEDGYRTCENALEQGRQAMEHCGAMRSDDFRSRLCLHKWPHVQATLPKNTQDVVRLLKSIQPLLQDAIQKKRTTRLWEATYTITGPLTWKDFHKLAGRGSEEACEPQPIPSLLVGFDKEWLSMAPHSVRYWERLSFEPYRKQRDVAYVVVAPDNDLVLSRVRRYFMELSSAYQLCRLGRHGPINKCLRDGIMRVGKSQAKKLRTEDVLDEWFDFLGESEVSEKIRLYGKVCKHLLAPHLAELTVDKSLLVSPASVKSMNKSRASTPLSTSQPSPHTPPQEHQQASSAASTPQSVTEDRDNVTEGLDRLRENTVTDTEPEEDDDLPTIVVYMIDPFTYGDDSGNSTRLSILALLRCFKELVDALPKKMQENVKLQIIPLNDVMDSSSEQMLDLQKFKSLAFSVYTRSAHPLNHTIAGRTLTGFGSASMAEQFLEKKTDQTGVPGLYNPPFILAARREKASLEPPSDMDKTDILFCVYCLSDDQRWLLAVCTDERGELLETCSINVDIPNRNRRKKASARKSGLRRLWDFLMSVIAMTTQPRRLVISRLGRLGHGEMMGWAGLLSKKNLVNANRSLREACGVCNSLNPSESVCILSACLIAMEVQPTFRVMPDVVKVEESQSSNVPMTTPRDASCTHILVFPTSATAAANSSVQLQENQIDIASSLGADIGDDDPLFSSLKEDLNLDQDLNGIFNLADSPVPSPGSPGRPCSPIMSSRRNSPSQFVGANSNSDSSSSDPQDEPPNLLQQPLAMGYYVSTAKPGPMPRWMWSNRAHVENNCPACFKFSLHVHSPSVTQNQDDLLHSTSNRSTHPLDSNFTCDVLRTVLETYNRLSWLTMDMAGNDRASCLPHHFLILMQLYHAMDTFV